MHCFWFEVTHRVRQSVRETDMSLPLCSMLQPSLATQLVLPRWGFNTVARSSQGSNVTQGDRAYTGVVQSMCGLHLQSDSEGNNNNSNNSDHPSIQRSSLLTIHNLAVTIWLSLYKLVFIFHCCINFKNQLPCKLYNPIFLAIKTYLHFLLFCLHFSSDQCSTSVHVYTS